MSTAPIPLLAVGQMPLFLLIQNHVITMLKQLLFIASLILCTALAAKAQKANLQQSIGKENVLLVVNFKPYDSYQKIDKETQKEYQINEILAPMILRLAGAEISEERVEKVAKQLADPSKAGLSVKGDVYFWIQKPNGVDKELYENEANPYLFNFILPISDHKKFHSFLSSVVTEEHMQEVAKVGPSNTMINDGTLLLWNDSRMILSTSSIEYNFFEEMSEFEERRSKILFQHSKSLLNTDAGKSLATDTEYQAARNQEADVSLWLNYDNLEPDATIYPVPMRSLMSSLGSLTEGSRISAHAFFRNGEVEVLSNFKMNDAIKRMTDKGYKKGGLNKKFYRYIDQTNLMGLYTLSTNTTGLMTSYGEEVYKAFQESDAPESKIVVNILDIVDIFFDEEEVYGLFEGDMAVAVTDLRVMEIERTDFQYDEESDQWNEVAVTEEAVMPIATMMFSLGDPANIQHFIDLGVNMGGLTKHKEGVWIVKDSKRELGMDLYVIMHDGLLMFSNDNNVTSALASGLAKNKQLPAATINAFSNYTQYAFFDVSKISKVTKKTYERIKQEAPNDLMELANIVDRLEVKSYYPEGNTFKTDFYADMHDEKSNALSLMLKGLGEIVPRGNSGMTPVEEEEEKDVKRL